MRRAALFFPAVLLGCSILGAAACKDLPTLRQGVCGNGVVDDGEDCDQFAPEGQQCGRSGTPVACRFECSSASDEGAPVCPAGWRCGRDDMCRAPAGRFSPVGVPIEAAVKRVLLGDFQGTGRSAVLGLGGASGIGAAYARLFYLRDDGSAVESSLLGFPVVSPQVRDLSGDGRDDFVTGLLGAIGVLLGQPQEDLLPVAYPLLTLQQGASTRAFPLRPYPGSLLDQEMIIFVSYGGEGAIESLTDEVTIATLPHTHDRLAGNPVVADIIRDPSAPCGEMLFAFRGEPEIWLLQPCEADFSWAGPDTSLRLAGTLPDGAIVETGAFVADIDSDGELDLVVGADQGRTFVSLGCGGGAFCSDKQDPQSAGRLLPVTASVGSSCSDVAFEVPIPPIAVGDVNGDGVPDVVTSSDVLVTESVDVQAAIANVEVCPAATKLVGQWSTARIVDMNLDGRSDVVAASSTALDIEFYAGTGYDRLNLTRITTPAPVGHMAIGDFDGDLVPDLAVGLIGAVEAQDGVRRDGLAVAYGRVQQAPEPIVPIAAFDGIDQVVAAHFDLGDAVEELGVVSWNDEQMQTVTVFLSSGGRQLLAPFGLTGGPAGPDPNADVSGTPLSLAVADFTGDGRQDIGAFSIADDNCNAEVCRFRMWLTPSLGDAKLSASLFGPELPEDVQPVVANESLGFEVAAFLVPWDVSGDGTRDLVLLCPMADATQEAGAWWVPWNATTGQLGGAQRLSRGPLQLRAQSHPEVTDLDGDGQPDVVLLSAGEAGFELKVAWGTSGLDLSAPLAVELPEPPFGFSLIHADTDDLIELVAIARAGAYLLQRSPSEPRVWSASPIEGVAGGTSVAARDIDGDGIDDLAIADELGVRLYRGRSQVP